MEQGSSTTLVFQNQKHTDPCQAIFLKHDIKFLSGFINLNKETSTREVWSGSREG